MSSAKYPLSAYLKIIKDNHIRQHNFKPIQPMNIAIQGCLHGQLDAVYDQLRHLQANTGITIDALIICGDFQATRDQIDLDYMHCPPKYKQMGSFQKYYSGKVPTPYLTIFIGGNHEAVNYMRDLYFGGWVAPKIYYLGQAGSIYLRKGEHKIRISGLSGIYNDYDFKYCLRTERLPLQGKSKVSCYHIKQIEIFRMELLARIERMKKQDPATYGHDGKEFDIFLTHDWPKDMAYYGNIDNLYQFKGFLKPQIESGQFGSAPSTRILSLAQPSYWFSAHMHVKYPALYPHPENKFTHFLSLDKCLKNRSCLQVLNFFGQQTQPSPIGIELDRTWLSVLKLTLNVQNQNRSLYKYGEKKTLQILDAQLMNLLIGKYAGAKDDAYPEVGQFENNLVKWQGQQQKGTEISQTLYLLKNVLKADPAIFRGVIIPADAAIEDTQPVAQQQQIQPPTDQIQLDL